MNYRACGCYCIKCNFCGKSVGIERTEFNYGSVVECDRAGSYVICCADAVVKDSIAKLKIKTPSGKTLIQSLSGGNQQKVIIARWLANNPDILIMDEPTRGIDVGAKYEIYQIMIDLVKQGKSIIMISSEMPELIGMSNRIIVMCNGHITGEVEGEDATQEKIMSFATKFTLSGKENK